MALQATTMPSKTTARSAKQVATHMLASSVSRSVPDVPWLLKLRMCAIGHWMYAILCPTLRSTTSAPRTFISYSPSSPLRKDASVGSIFMAYDRFGPVVSGDRNDGIISSEDLQGYIYTCVLAQRLGPIKGSILTTNLAAVVCVCAQNLTNFCPYALISNPYVPKILFA